MSDPIRPTYPHQRTLAELAARRSELIARTSSNQPTVADCLELLAVEESICRYVNHGLHIYWARQAGATWAQIGAALDLDQLDAAVTLSAWIDGQAALYRYGVAEGRDRPPGLDPEQSAAALKLLDEDPT